MTEQLVDTPLTREEQEFIAKLPVATHEAGHAVVAAYLRYPFKKVEISFKTNGDSFRTGGEVRMNPEASRYTKHLENGRLEIHPRLLRKDSIVTLAARAAVETLPYGYSTKEEERNHYKHDEENLRQFARILGVSRTGFNEWRSDLLTEARRIIALPFIARAIEQVAEHLVVVNQMSAKDVRKLLFVERLLADQPNPEEARARLLNTQ